MIALAASHGRETLRAGLREAGQTGRQIVFLIPVAIISAGFIAQTLPHEQIGDLIGPESGFMGILVAALAGAVIPGGPMVSFPIALALLNAGAGVPQLVALLTGWSVYALHRVLIWEIPLLGMGFTKLRIASNLALPPLAGLLAGLIWSALG
jgi:uncharacterized membrane protein YraQ (UPF0718 family)